ncbi:MAG: F0F1 ATP synthase subunit epsilon [Gemmatimonadota bacterium]
MARKPKLSVALITPQATVYEGEADMVVLPAWDGEVGILRGHAPMMALLGEGTMRVTLEEEGEQRFFVAGGFMQVADNVVSILSDKAERR